MDFQQCRSLPDLLKRVPGTLYRHIGGDTYLCLPDRSLLRLEDLLDYLYAHAAAPHPGPRGPQGEKGESIVGPAGKDGRDGKDSVVPGPRGLRGVAGEAATIRVGKVETLAAGESARVENVGTPTNAVLNFFIPAGATGAQGPASTVPGPKGDTGPRGDVLVLDAGEVAAAALRLKQERAAMQAKIQQAIDDTASLPHGPRRLVKGRLENLKGKL